MACSPSPSLDSLTSTIPISSLVDSGSDNSSGVSCLDGGTSIVYNTKCYVCSDNLDRPRVLTACLHSFCFDCVDKLVELSGDKVLCPKCAVETQLPISGVIGLLPDYVALNWLDVSTTTTVIDDDAANAVNCTGCKGKESNAVARCYDCAAFLCGNCVMAHQFMHCFADHTYLPLGELQNGGVPTGTLSVNGGGLRLDELKMDKPLTCPKHKNDVLKYFCRTCNVPVCKECTVMDHPKNFHECEHLSDVSQKLIENMSQMMDEGKSKVGDLHNTLKTVDHVANQLATQYHKAQSEVNETFEFYQSILDERKNELLKELDSVFSSKQVCLNSVSQKVHDTIEKIHKTNEFAEKLIKYASHAEILVFKKVLENKLLQAINYCPDVGLQNASELEFVSNFPAIQAGVHNTFGYIRSSPDMHQLGGNKQPPIARPSASSSSSISLSNGFSSSAQTVPTFNNGFNNIVTAANNGGVNVDHSRIYGNGHLSPFESSLSQLQSVTNSNNGGGRQQRYGNNSGGSSLGDGLVNAYERWSNGANSNSGGDIFHSFSDSSNNSPLTTQTPPDSVMDIATRLNSAAAAASIYPPKSHIKRQKMIYHCKFGEFGVMEGQFTEPSGVAVNAQNDIIVADTNNHRIQIFDKDGRFKFQFGECGKRDGQLLYPNRVAVVRPSGDIVVTERSPTHQIQIYNQYGQFVRKFGANILQHPRGVTVDSQGRIIVVECKVMRVIVFDQMGTVLHKFGCSKHLEFPNGVVVNDKQEIFISDNRAHCVKVFSFQGAFLRQIGGEGVTNFPIGVGINANGEILVADNHNNFNLTVFTQDGQFVAALESKVKHAQCFDVALMDDGSVVLASKDYRLYVYRYTQQQQPVAITTNISNLCLYDTK